MSSAQVADTFCRLICYEIYRAVLRYIQGNYHAKNRGENSIEGVTAIIQIT